MTKNNNEMKINLNTIQSEQRCEKKMKDTHWRERVYDLEYKYNE